MADIKPWDMVKHICEKTPLDFEVKKDYNAWMVNRGLSNILETVFFAEMMDRLPALTKEMQLAFYFNAVPKAKRFGKWHKAAPLINIMELLMKRYQVNQTVAASYLKLMDDAAIKRLQDQMDVGGK